MGPEDGLLRFIRGLERAVVVPHILVDVDALATADALCRVLDRIGVHAVALVPDRPDIFAWALDERLRVREALAEIPRIAVDTARPERLQVTGPVQVCIDHHEDNPGFAPFNWIEAAPSCTCLVARLAEALGVEVDAQLATILYRGLAGDTQGFTVGLEPEAFRWAARWVEVGADAEGVSEDLQRRSPGFWSYLSQVEQHGVSVDGPVPLRVVGVAQDLPERCGLLPYEHALLPNHIQPPAGGVLAILQEGSGGVRFRIRSRDFDVLPLAHRLGGGGHPHAAGVQMQGVGMETARKALLAAWDEAVEAAFPQQVGFQNR